ncbi:MAG TPA: hypothetical protein VLS89_20460, partial [Candidatus Nanopelagicales bacterium]|nr:hypothetical protein [Candidatus Nanopelagicales bacterium]
MTSKTGDPKDEGAATRQAEQASPEEHGMPAAGSPAPDVLADAVGRAGLGPDVVEALTRWLAKELVDDQFARLEQAGHRGERRIPLARVFVDLEVSVSPQPEPTGSSERPGFARTVLGMSPGSIAQEASRLDPTLRRSGAAGFVLIGGPGQGKSTLCQIVCQIHRGELLRHRANALPQAARDALGGLGELQEQEGLGRPAAPCFPVRIALADAAAWLSSEDREGRPAVASGEGIAAVVLLRYLSARLRAQAGILITPGDMGQVLAVCPWMLVLDGLDEVPVAADRGRVLAAARDLIARLSADGAEGLLLATTRPQGYLNELDGLGVPLQAVHLAPLSSLQALRYAERLLERLLVDQAERRRSVLDRLRIATEQQETARLMRSPLQVTIMTTLVDRIGRAPGERWSLFRDYYRVMYEREMERAAQGEVAESLRNHRPYIDRVHAHVGLLLQVESERAGGSEALMSAERLRQVIDAVLAEDEMERAQRDALARQIIWVARDRLVLLVEAQPGRFGFEVRSFQEFMAAWALSARGEAALEARITQIAGAASFRDVVLFLASKCFTELSDLREAFAERICPRLNEPPKGEALRSRLEGSVLALEILEEGSA